MGVIQAYAIIAATSFSKILTHCSGKHSHFRLYLKYSDSGVITVHRLENILRKLMAEGAELFRELQQVTIAKAINNGIKHNK